MENETQQASAPADEIDTKQCDIEDDLPCKVSVGSGMLMTYAEEAGVEVPTLQAVADSISTSGKTTVSQAKAAFQEAVAKLPAEYHPVAKTIVHETFPDLFPEAVQYRQS